MADIALLATYTTISTTKDTLINLDDWPTAKKWSEAVKEKIPNYSKVNGEGVIKFQNMVREKTILKV